MRLPRPTPAFPPARNRPLALVLLAALLPCVRAAPAPPAAAAPHELVAGVSADIYPYSFQDADGKLHGFTVELFQAVIDAMGLHAREEVRRSMELQSRFRAGDFSLLLNYSHSPDRESVAEFSVPYLTLQGSVFVRRDGPVHRYEDLEGRTFAIVGRGSIGESFLRDRGLHVRIMYASSSLEALRCVESGACAGTFVSRLTALSVIDHDHLAGLKILGEPLAGYEIRQAFAVHKGDAKLLAQLNEGLAIVHRSGQFDEIYGRWFGGIDAPLFTTRQRVVYALTALLLGLLAALGGCFWQRALRRRLARQAAELARQGELLKALYDHIPMGMSVIQFAARGPLVLSMNREAGRLYGVDPETTIDQPLAGLPLAAGARHHLEEVLRRRPPTEQIVHYEQEVEGGRGVLDVTIVPLSPGAGGCPRVCVLVEDVSSRKLLDAELAQSRKLRAVGELVGGIAHEFNNLLTPVMLKIGEIQADWPGDEPLQREVAVVAQATQRAAELTRRLLTFGRKSEARADAVALGELIASSFELLRSTLDRRIQWKREVPADLPPLRFNATDLNQILINLLLNARDTLMEKIIRSPADGWTPEIRVSVAPLPAAAATPGKSRVGAALVGWQRLTVKDNGLGMAPSVVERAFEPFFTTREVGKGTGLGLATVWHLVTGAGGRVEVESEAGAGSAFHVFLPVWSSVEGFPPKPAPAAPGAPLPPARVLLIEDEDLVAQTVMAILRRGGHEVVHLADGTAAWQHLAGGSPGYDLLVIDVNLPGVNGVDLVGRLRERAYAGRILVVSGRIGLSDLRSLVQFNVDRVLTKPFTAQQFEAALRECLAQGGN